MGFGRAVHWLNRTGFDLRESEGVVLDGVAGHVRGILPTHGRLVLTTFRLIYLPMYSRLMPSLWRCIEIDLSEIQSVRRRSWFRGLWGGLPGLPVFSVQLSGEGEMSFQTIFAGRWKEEISRRLARAG
jgi:hypothetical protein